jgi:hypothetical protein
LREIAIRIVRPARQIGEPDIRSVIIAFSEFIMRNRLMLLTATVLLSACADDQQSTAPASRAASSRSANGNVGAATQTAGSPQAKPIDQVGFTKVTLASSELVHATPGSSNQAIATCPAGTTAIGGSYKVTLYTAGYTPPFMLSGALDDQNGWKVVFSNEVPGAGYFTFFASATCAS